MEYFIVVKNNDLLLYIIWIGFIYNVEGKMLDMKEYVLSGFIYTNFKNREI